MSRKFSKKSPFARNARSPHVLYPVRRRRRPPRLETGDSQSAVSAPLFSMMHTSGGPTGPPLFYGPSGPRFAGLRGLSARPALGTLAIQSIIPGL